MIIRKILLLAITLLLLQVSWGQTDKPSVGVLKLESSGLPEHKAVKINKYIESAFYNSNRFDIVTRQLQEAVSQEREQQKGNIDAIAIQQGKAIGADYFVKGSARGYKQSITKSSPKSRGPSRSTTRPSSKSSPRSATKKKTDTSTDKKPTKTAKTTPKATTAPARSNTATVTPQTTLGKTTTQKPKEGKKEAIKKTKTLSKVTSKKAPVTSPKKKTEAKEEKPKAPLSAEVDRIYTNTQINFNIEILDVKTGVIIKEKAYNGSINRLSYFVQKLLREAFPYDFQIVEIMEMKGKKKAKNLLVYGGSNHGLGIGSSLQVYEVLEEEVDGSILEREVKVGRLFVQRLETGGNFSLCTITKGRKTLLEKINNGAKLVCR